jgi:hypothetical protein
MSVNSLSRKVVGRGMTALGREVAGGQVPAYGSYAIQNLHDRATRKVTRGWTAICAQVTPKAAA